MARRKKEAVLPVPETLPEHSPLGASSAERWMQCPGSVALANALGADTDEDPDYRADGTEAHNLADRCLTTGAEAWEHMAEFPRVTSEISSAVQEYLDYVRSLPGRHLHEQDVAHSAFHPLMYGRLDFAAINIDPETIQTDAIMGVLMAEFVDYKNGVGVTVEVNDNPQLKYYVFALLDGEVWPADLPRLPDDAVIRLTIAQPRVTWHRDGPIRSWDTTAGAIREWAYGELRAAMERAGTDTFQLGEHCRFCRAKLVCPAMRNLAADGALAAKETADLPNTDDEWLGQWFERVPQLKMFCAAIEAEVKKRLFNGGKIATAKMVYGLVDRVWKDDAPVAAQFGAEAWKPAELRSPAQVEKLPGGKAFVAEWSQKPKPPITVAGINDRRPAVEYQSDDEAFAAVRLEFA